MSDIKIKKTAAIIALAAPLLLGGCAAAVMAGGGQGGYHQQNGPAAEASRADARLSAAVTRRLVEDRQVAAMDIQVRVRQGIVTLEGRVASLEVARRAESLTRTVEGVRSVRNLLTVAPANRR